MSEDCTLTESGEEQVREFTECIQDADTQDKRDACLVQAEESGMEVVGEGSSRITMTTEDSGLMHGADDCVVKVAKSPDTDPGEGLMNVVPESHEGNLQNEREAETWEDLPESLRDDFVPVHDYEEDYDWITSPRASPGATGLELWYLKRQLRKEGWHCDDLDKENIGRLGWRPRIIDYGLECGEE